MMYGYWIITSLINLYLYNVMLLGKINLVLVPTIFLILHSTFMPNLTPIIYLHI